MERSSDQNRLPSLPASLLARVQAVAEREHRSASEVVREAIERYLEHICFSSASSEGASDKARQFEAWPRNHPYTPPLPDEALQRETLVRDSNERLR